VGLVVEGFEIVVAGRFRQIQGRNNGRLFGGEPGALRDGAGSADRPGLRHLVAETVGRLRAAGSAEDG